MQLMIRHAVEKLILPINYHHVLQSIIFQGLRENKEYGDFLHNRGYSNQSRSFKMFTFGPIQGKYRIREKQIIFTGEICWEVRSVDAMLLRLLQESIRQDGIVYGKQHFTDIEAILQEFEIEEEEICIRMLSPICVYATDAESGKTTYFHPAEEEFVRRINENFQRKYVGYTGVEPDSKIQMELLQLCEKDKYVTNYKGFYITAWKGRYTLRGKRKYLNFLYQTGLGSKNAQGFGMFEVLK